MGRFSLAPAAKDDLAEIAKYIQEQGSEGAARRVLLEMHHSMQALADMPGMGHLRQDLSDESLRFWSVYSYLIIYRPETQPLQIIRILHGARDIASVLESQVAR